MRQARRWVSFIALLVAVALPSTSCTEDSGPAGGAPLADRDSVPLAIATTFYPTTYLTQRLAGDLAGVEGVDPTPSSVPGRALDGAAVAALQQASLVILHGAGSEDWVDQIVLDDARVVVSTHGLGDRLLLEEGAVTHSHGPSGEHAHAEVDPHTWLDPVLAKAQAEHIRRALTTRLPGHTEQLRERFDGLARDLDELHARHRGVAERLGETPLLASKPVYRYLGARYGWNVRSVDLEVAGAPTPDQLQAIAGTLESHPAQILVWHAEPTAAALSALSKFDLRHVVFSRLESKPREGDFLSVTRQGLDALEAALSR
jgi:zinc transport system substrate-binding protein